MNTLFRVCSFVLFIGSFFSCKSDEKEIKFELKEENVSYSADTATMEGYVAWNNAVEGKRPVVLIIHEWWGNNLYPKSRAEKLAQLGYLAMAIDMYGNGKLAETPEEAGAMAMPFYTNPGMAKERFDAALNKIKTYPQADTSRIAVIGYCFGGAQAINFAKMGENLKGVVSFHGNLNLLPTDREKLKSAILVCHGGADEFVPETEVTQFKREMDSIKADYTFRSYPGATHAFTNPAATATGQKFNLPIAYNAEADSLSWLDMKAFFKKIF